MYFNTPVRMMVNFRTRTPKGDGNIRTGRFGRNLCCISEHEPRKGTETNQAHLFCYRVKQFQNTNPERGRKLTFSSDVKASRFFVFQNTNPERGRKLKSPVKLYETEVDFRTRTPKGDGNSNDGIHFSKLVNFRTRTPKGDGNAGLSSILLNFFIRFQNTNPERGRKHRVDRHPFPFRAQFQNTNPERGRKQSDAIRSTRACIAFQNTNPERGRKLENLVCEQLQDVTHFRTRTPKGDGNCTGIQTRDRPPYISEHEPRKGTETIFACDDLLPPF